MKDLTNDTIGGFNSFLKEQQEVTGDAIISTVLFNDSYKLLHDRVDIKKVNPITEKDYIAKGYTALLDAMGKTINDIGLKLSNAAESERPGKVIFFIITDGEENSSREYSQEKVKEMVELQKNTYSWEFIFMGANIDSFSTAASIGISADRAFDIAPTGKGMYAAEMAMGMAVRNFRLRGNIDDGEDFRGRIKKPKHKK
jgi:uncharacterized protein YegL